jgi:propionyl-CoA carboxylase alpha chain
MKKRRSRRQSSPRRTKPGRASATTGLFIEKFVTEPRHIEIQVLGDKHGNVIYLGERECSIQRRHQKVIEEAPSPFLDAATRKAMGEQAVSLAKAVGYDSAGTVEFIVDKDRKFYFLEMNTRLQVEHPVTELITGLDLVELMIRSAAGEKLTIKQGRCEARRLGGRVAHLCGRSLSRLPAVDRPARALSHRRRKASTARHRVRNDTGVYEGGEISIYYDPMIAKLCTHAPTRTGAIDAMAEGARSNSASKASITTSISSPRSCTVPAFREGRLTTGFIAEEYPDGFHGVPLDDAHARRFHGRGRCATKSSGPWRGRSISGTLNGAHARRIGLQR